MPGPLKGTDIYRVPFQALKGGFMLYALMFRSNNSVIWALRLSLELRKETQRIQGQWLVSGSVGTG